MESKKIVLSILSLYLLIFCNFTKELVGCKLTYLLDTNIYFKHIIAFILLLFLIILIDEENIKKSIFVNLIFAIIIYIFFLISTRINYIFIIIILILLLCIYILDKISLKEKENNNKINYDYYQKIEIILIILVTITIIIGFIKYMIEKYNEYNKNFSLLTFIFGTLKCKLT